MLFAVPIVWLESTDHSSNCYFFMTSPITSGWSMKKRRKYPYNILSVAHSNILPIPKTTKNFNIEETDSQNEHESFEE